MSDLNNKNDFDRSSGYLEEDGIIKIDEIIQIIFNNKKLISSLTFFGFIISIIITYTRSDIWAGKFQILVRKDKNLIDNSS